MPDVLVRNVPHTTLDGLKQRAAQHHRSLQQELLSIVDAAAALPADRSPAQIAAAIRERLAQSGRTFTDSTPLIREDRDR